MIFCISGNFNAAVQENLKSNRKKDAMHQTPYFCLLQQSLMSLL